MKKFLFILSIFFSCALSAQECLPLPTDTQTVSDNGDGSSTITHTAVDGTVSTFITWECVDADGDGTPSWLDDDDNDPCITPTLESACPSDCMSINKVPSISTTLPNGGYTINETFQWIVTVCNCSLRGPLTGVTVTDVIDNPNMQVDASTVSKGGYNIGAGIWSVGTIGPGECETLTLFVTPQQAIAGPNLDDPVDVTNTATASSNETGDEVATSIVPGKPCTGCVTSTTADNSTGWNNSYSFTPNSTTNGTPSWTGIAPNGGIDEVWGVNPDGSNFANANDWGQTASGTRRYFDPGFDYAFRSYTCCGGGADIAVPNAASFTQTNDWTQSSKDWATAFNTAMGSGFDLQFGSNPYYSFKNTVAAVNEPFFGYWTTLFQNCAECSIDTVVIEKLNADGTGAGTFYRIKFVKCPSVKTCEDFPIRSNTCN